ncbi:class IV adenylate cyclase [Candidatus Kaiserbacteria bacterium]|nr:class IV adenylate cyclase [Candidatus Kaiserbacteria bacterium]
MKSEIEVKARVRDAEAVVAKLADLGCALSEPITQDDFVYNKIGVDPKDHSHGTPVLRIRVQGERTIFTLKKNRSNELDCIEKEIDVSDKDILADIFELLGYEKTIEVHKMRRKGAINGYEVCLDEVRDLGTFIEVEKMSDEDGAVVQKELFDFLAQFGIREEDRVLIGYDTQLWLKHNQ